MKFRSLNSFRFKLFLGILTSCLSACFLDNPVKETSYPTELEYNQWLLARLYLYADELSQAFEEDSVSALYLALSDTYTRYIQPSKAEEGENEINTSIIAGDIGVEIFLDTGSNYPLFLYRVYPEGPAGRAGILRYSRLISVNGIDLSGDLAYTRYLEEMQTHKELTLVVYYAGEFFTYNLLKEAIYAPTVFADTLSGVTVITIREFTLKTSDREEGTLGELKKILAQTNDNSLRVIDIRNNPGGHISQCTGAADLLVESGVLSIRISNQMDAYGKKFIKTVKTQAVSGDIGENRPFLIAVNRYTASCGEIFAAAVSENTSIPLVGETTYGKGIGQTIWNTAEGGMAVITSTELRTPLGKNYHKQGISPDIDCENANLECILNTAASFNGVSLKKKEIIFTHDLLTSSFRPFFGALEKGE